VQSEEVLEGTLTTDPLPVLLARVAGNGMTGALKVDDKGEVWVDQGRIYLAITPSSPDLSAVFLDPLIDTMDADRRHPVGLADQSLELTLEDHPEIEDDLQRLLHEFTLNSLFELLVVTEGSYQFEPGRIHPIGSRFAEDTGDLVAKAEQRLEIWRRIATRIPSTSAVFTLSPSLPSDIGERLVTADEWRFLSRLNGRNTVADIINQTGESAFRVCSVLYRLLLEELIEEEPGR
jgi:hypothetical protein